MHALRCADGKLPDKNLPIAKTLPICHAVPGVQVHVVHSCDAKIDVHVQHWKQISNCYCNSLKKSGVKW
jgi:hypothetical protein